MVRSYKLKDLVREAKLEGLLCNSFVLSCMKSIIGMEVLWDDRNPIQDPVRILSGNKVGRILQRILSGRQTR